MSELTSSAVSRRPKAVADTTTSRFGDIHTRQWWNFASALAQATLHEVIPRKILAVTLEREGRLKHLGLALPALLPSWYIRLNDLARKSGITGIDAPAKALDFGQDVPPGPARMIREGKPLLECLTAFLEIGDPDFRALFGGGLPVPVRENPTLRLRQAHLCAAAVGRALRRHLIGQLDAVEALQRMAFEAELRGAELRSCPTALFLGPPGVGKTFAARTFAQALADWRQDERGLGLLTLEMTQYIQWASSAELFGDGSRVGTLCAHVTRHPRAVIVVNEFEKAHRKVLEGFLPVLDQGFLPNGDTPMDAHQVMFVFSSNLGSEWWDRPGNPEEDAFAADPMELLSLAERPDEKSEWYKTPVPKELLSRLAKGAVVLFHRPQGHHLLAKLQQGGVR